VIIAGLDVGLAGAVALLDTTTSAVRTVDMPVLTLRRGGKTKRELDPHQLVAILGAAGLDHVFVEDVHAMPGQGVSGVFAFGQAKGVVIGILAALGTPWTTIAPAAWKKALRVPAAKDGARARASQLLPGGADQWPLSKHHGRAEAALVALFGAQSLTALTRGDAAFSARAAGGGRG
jgi:crossover junction endodeoxyribonuclease RuvC